jgi:hypothetical protein
MTPAQKHVATGCAGALRLPFMPNTAAKPALSPTLSKP